MKLVHAIFERGVFRPTEFVDLLDGCEVDFELRVSQASDVAGLTSFSSRLNELRTLEDGWLDGKGVAPSSTGLDWLEQRFVSNYSEELPSPFLYPTAEGGVQIEWTIGGCEASLEIDLANHQAHWHCLNLKTAADSFYDFNLDDTSDWAALIQEVRQLAGSES